MLTAYPPGVDPAVIEDAWDLWRRMWAEFCEGKPAQRRRDLGERLFDRVRHTVPIPALWPAFQDRLDRFTNMEG